MSAGKFIWLCFLQHTLRSCTWIWPASRSYLPGPSALPAGVLSGPSPLTARRSHPPEGCAGHSEGPSSFPSFSTCPFNTAWGFLRWKKKPFFFPATCFILLGRIPSFSEAFPSAIRNESWFLNINESVVPGRAHGHFSWGGFFTGVELFHDSNMFCPVLFFRKQNGEVEKYLVFC